MKTKTWMVEQRWKIPPAPVVPIRSVVEAKTKREAQKKAAEAVRAAIKVLLGEVRGEPVSDPVVLYPLAGVRILKEK